MERDLPFGSSLPEIGIAGLGKVSTESRWANPTSRFEQQRMQWIKQRKWRSTTSVFPVSIKLNEMWPIHFFSFWTKPLPFGSNIECWGLRFLKLIFFFIRRNLTFLNLSNTDINTWDDIDRLAKFPALRNLRVQNWPLWEKCDATEHERRQLLIARLPYVQTLNGGGKITSEEREDAERAFIRYYLDKPEADRPERYNELIAVHGKLDPLVKIDLRPEKRVKITFTYGDTSEVRPVDVYR